MRVVAPAVALAAGALALSACGTAQTLRRPWIGAGAAGTVQLRAIEDARARNPELSIFPALPGTIGCLIPSGGIVSRQLHGSCRTAVHWARNRHEPLLVVVFTERWPKPACPAGATCDNLGRFSWVVRVEPPRTLDGRPVVLATRTRGTFPPQAVD